MKTGLKERSAEEYEICVNYGQDDILDCILSVIRHMLAKQGD